MIKDRPLPIPLKEIFEKLAEELSKGKIIALKNTAGYLLMCDATNSEAVLEQGNGFKDNVIAAE